MLAAPPFCPFWLSLQPDLKYSNVATGFELVFLMHDNLTSAISPNKIAIYVI